MMAPHPSNRVRAVKPTELRLQDMTCTPAASPFASTSKVTARPLPPRSDSLKTRSPESRVRGKIGGCHVHMRRRVAGSSAGAAARPAGPAP